MQIPEYSASRGPRARGRGCKTALKAPILSPNASRAARFFTGCGPWCLPFAQNPVCRHPRLLNTPKNARRILPQAPAARRRIVSASLVVAGAPGLTSQIFPQDGRTPPREAHGGVLTCPRTIWEVSPGAPMGRFRPRLFVAEADAQRLGLAHQIALGIDKLELAGDILERHVAHLAIAQGNHVAKLAA